jgi:hypothetical protein
MTVLTVTDRHEAGEPERSGGRSGFAAASTGYALPSLPIQMVAALQDRQKGGSENNSPRR